MTKLNPTELAEQHKKDQIKARNREYQKLYYKLHKKEILKKKKKKREETKLGQIVMRRKVVLLRGMRKDANIRKNITLNTRS